MWIDTEDAIKIYARFCRAHYGAGAIKKARERARYLERVGDVEGHQVWNGVADEIGALQRAPESKEVN
jgi:hypothetical protein